MERGFAGQILTRVEADGTADFAADFELLQFNAKDVAIGFYAHLLTATLTLKRWQPGGAASESILTLYRTLDPAFTDPAGEATCQKTANILNLGGATVELGFTTVSWGAGGYVYVWVVCMAGP